MARGRSIVRYPDPRLALPALPCDVFDDALRDLARDLLETLHAAPGIGITGPHIGVSLRVAVFDLHPFDGAWTEVNPEIICASPEMILHQEGSVSMLGVNDEVSRHARVRISYRDIDGNKQAKESRGLRAVCHQHEIDQLNGLFWIRRLSRLKRERLIKRFEKASPGRETWGCPRRLVARLERPYLQSWIVILLGTASSPKSAKRHYRKDQHYDN